MGWSEIYESSFSQVLHSCLLRLCSENLPVAGKIEIDGIVCINVANAEKQIVLKIHDIVDKSKSSVNSRHEKPVTGHEGFVSIDQQTEYENKILSSQKKQKERDLLSHSGTSKMNTQVCESDDALIDFYKKGVSAFRPSASLLPPSQKRIHSQQPDVSPRSKQIQAAVRQQAAPATTVAAAAAGSRRKQAKPHMVTYVPEDDEEEAMSTGDMENWYGAGSDSENETDASNLSVSMPSMSLLPYSQNHRPPRQRVPLKDELQTGLAIPSDYVCRKCNTKFPGFAQLQVHNMEVHKRYTCKQCQTTFSLRCNLRRHERLHEGHKPFQCQWCPKTFSRNGDLKIHEWKHKEATGTAVSKMNEIGLKQEMFGENGVDDEGIIVIEPTDADEDEYMSCSNDSVDMSAKKNVSSSLDLSKQSGSSAFSAVKPNKPSETLPVASLLAQMKSVSRDLSCGGTVESILDSQQMSDSVMSLYSKYIGNSPSASIANLAQQTQEAAGFSASLLSQSNKSSKKPKPTYPAVHEALKDWSSAPNSPAQARNVNSPSPGPNNAKSTDSSPKGSPKAAPVPRSQHYCLLCKEWWEDFAAYESHCAGVHGRYPCQYCGQTFSNKNNRARHGRSHTGQKQFTCGHCGKSFTRSDILREHQIIHTESYHGDQCQYCGTKITTKKADLLAHIKKCIQLNKYSPSMIQAKIEAAANGVESTLPLEYTPTKLFRSVSQFNPATPEPKVFLVMEAKDASVAEQVAPNEDSGPVDHDTPSKISPRSLLSNNNKGEKTPPKLPNNEIMAEGGILEAVPIHNDD